MEAQTWYVLRVGTRDETLLRCTPSGHRALELPPTAPSRNPALDQTIPADRVQDASPLTPEGARHAVAEHDPRATHVVNDPAFEKDGRERHFRALGQALREARREDEGPIVVAMDPTRAALFDAVAGVPVTIVLPEAGTSSPEALWRTSKAALQASA